MKFNVITIFPDLIASYCNESILKRAQKANLITVHAVNLRDFANNKHNTVDDTPYGGGAGMVMKSEPIYAALKSLDAIPFHKADGLTKVKKIFGTLVGNPSATLRVKKRTILLSPRGRQFDQRLAEQWGTFDELTFVCGRYEGVDQRVVDHMIDEEVSVGPYVLAGGELGALIIIEAVARLIPGVLGNAESLREETHTLPPHHRTIAPQSPSGEVVQWSSGSVEYPQYTKPADFRGWKVPEVLLSGDHKKIAEWRKGQ
jgi:tRNA (guanine37-N1)-methyltransferase